MRFMQKPESYSVNFGMTLACLLCYNFVFLDGQGAVSSSNIPIEGSAMDGTSYVSEPPKSISIEEIKETVMEFAEATKKASRAWLIEFKSMSD